MIATSSPEKTTRRTLLQRAGEVNVKDPGAHARHCVSELDKTAKKSALKRKQCNDQIAQDLKDISHVEEQLLRLNERYVPLCDSLDQAKERKKQLLELLATCEQDEKEIMKGTKEIMNTSMIDNAKLCRKTATMELQTLRGFTMQPESTFHQGGNQSLSLARLNNNNGTFPPIRK